MVLYCSLPDECEEELNLFRLRRSLDALRKPLMTRTIYLKRRYLHEFESGEPPVSTARASELIVTGRVGRVLQSVGIDITTVYDREARDSRFLERMRLSLT